MFDRLQWKSDRVLLDDLVFRLEHTRPPPGQPDDWRGGEHFRFHKVAELVEQYRRFFARVPEFAAERIVELGIFDGGSTAFWFELFRPQKLVACDLADKKDSPYFERFVESRGAGERITTHWRTDQADGARLRSILDSDLGGPIDLVVDDASHLYQPTRSAFEALFPRVRAGGFYVIEDWAWHHWPDFAAPDHPWSRQLPLTRLVRELIEAAGTSYDLVASVTVYSGFTVVERGPLRVDATASLDLEQHIFRRPECE